jgi:hypothetical protein
MHRIVFNGPSNIECITEMNTVKKIVRDFTFRTLMRKFPRSSFPVFKKINLEPDAVKASDVTAFLRHYAFDEAWIFHGIAMEREGKAIVVSGPPGIGKSTLLRKCAGSNMAKPLDDGFILAGKADNKYYVVESGLYLSLRTISVLSKFLRIVCRCRVPYRETAGHPDMDKALARGQSLSNLAVLLGAVVARDRGSEVVASSPVRLAKLF